MTACGLRRCRLAIKWSEGLFLHGTATSLIAEKVAVILKRLGTSFTAFAPAHWAPEDKPYLEKQGLSLQSQARPRESMSLSFVETHCDAQFRCIQAMVCCALGAEHACPR